MRGIAAVLVSLLFCGPAAAQDPPSRRVTLLANWLASVRCHDPGHDDADAYALARWPNADIKALWLDLQTLVRFVRCQTCGTTWVEELESTRRAVIRYSTGDLK